MWVLMSICLLASAMAHPLSPLKANPAQIMNKRSVQADGEVLERSDSQNVQEHIVQGDAPEEMLHAIKKREIDEMAAQDDCSQFSGDEFQTCNGQRVKRQVPQAVTSGTSGEESSEAANQNGNIQEAWSNEGAYARQGEGGQFVSASDFGGPIVQILQHVYKANCCACGCDCGCPGEP